jgi:hypothetical protein
VLDLVDPLRPSRDRAAVGRQAGRDEAGRAAKGPDEYQCMWQSIASEHGERKRNPLASWDSEYQREQLQPLDHDDCDDRPDERVSGSPPSRLLPVNDARGYLDARGSAKPPQKEIASTRRG